ncbi:hypothetical protein NDU88_004029 [Pleurodeles waltl]|uniref:Uncharacterized protein n=1 Tax=Pleurodeles waltl TaxID=8319 RepID=A0AAV7NL35_PLEWA|nr:hypothetical protein NDU88_004029 [Pleurodeles waltl]
MPRDRSRRSGTYGQRFPQGLRGGIGWETRAAKNNVERRHSQLGTAACRARGRGTWTALVCAALEGIETAPDDVERSGRDVALELCAGIVDRGPATGGEVRGETTPVIRLGPLSRGHTHGSRGRGGSREGGSVGHLDAASPDLAMKQVQAILGEGPTVMPQSADDLV